MTTKSKLMKSSENAIVLLYSQKSGESHNLAANNSAILDKMISAYDKYAKDVGVILPDPKTFPSSLYGSLVDRYGQKNATTELGNATQEENFEQMS